MATRTDTTFDNLDESLANALWFVRNGRLLMALATLRSAAASAHGELQVRIGRMVAELEGARIADLAVA